MVEADSESPAQMSCSGGEFLLAEGIATVLDGLGLLARCTVRSRRLLMNAVTLSLCAGRSNVLRFILMNTLPPICGCCIQTCLEHSMVDLLPSPLRIIVHSPKTTALALAALSVVYLAVGCVACCGVVRICAFD